MSKNDNEKIVKNYLKENLTLFNDRIFREVANNKDFVTELLRVFLNNKELEIIELFPQKDFTVYNQRSVTLDLYCKMSDSKVAKVELVNVEVENNAKGDKHDHQRRVRYHGSMIDVKNLFPNDGFSDLPDLYMVYLTVKDFIGQHKTVYHVERQVVETKSYLDNGYHEIYINAEVNDKSEIAEVMRILSTPNYVNKNFKTISKVKEEKLMPIEVEKAMNELKNEYRLEGELEGELKGKLEAFVNLLRQGLISEEVVLDNLKISKEELESKIKEYAI